MKDKNNIYYVPFNTSKKDVVYEFKKSCKALFTPNFFNRKSITDKIKGVYIPIYLLDYETHGELIVDCKKKSNFRSGNYNYLKEDKYELKRKATVIFENIPVSGVKLIENDKLVSIMPYDYSKLKLLEDSEYKIEKENVTKERLNNDALKVVKDNFISYITDGMKEYEDISIKNDSINISVIKISRILVPVWILDFEYKHEKYFFIMNGENKKSYHNLPKIKSRAIKIYILLFVLLSCIAFVIQYLRVIL